MDKKHQIIIGAQAFGEGSEHHTLTPVLATIKDRYARTGISDDIYKEGVIVTADTGFSNESNNQYLKDENINAYIPDNLFRSHDKAFAKQKEKYGKRHQDTAKGIKQIIPASEFAFDKKNKTCVCPEGKSMWLHREYVQPNGKPKSCLKGD